MALVAPVNNRSWQWSKFFDAKTQAKLNQVNVGSLPDMVTFTPDGTKVLTANEGEPDGGVNPEGSVSIIDISGGVQNASVTLADFNDFDSQKAALQAEGVRLFGDNGTATVSQDVEPEYITVSSDSTNAYISLQENNAIAILDLTTSTITDIFPLGVKDHSLPGNGLDASDRDGGINIQTQPVFGLPMPDAIATYNAGGVDYIVTANEGDARDEDARVGGLNVRCYRFPRCSDSVKITPTWGVWKSPQLMVTLITMASLNSLLPTELAHFQSTIQRETGSSTVATTSSRLLLAFFPPISILTTTRMISMVVVTLKAQSPKG